MKRRLPPGLTSAVLLATFFFTSSPPLVAQSRPYASNSQAISNSVATITVTGHAELHIPADSGTLCLEVITVDEDLQSALVRNDEIVSRAITIAERNGIPREDIQTSTIEIKAIYDELYFRDILRNLFRKESLLSGYLVRKSLTLSITDLEKTEVILRETIRAGINQVQGISYTSTKLEEFRTEAASKALENAKKKAKELALSLGKTIGQPISIYEVTPVQQGEPHPQGYGAPERALSSKPRQAFAPGLVPVRASVTATFELLPNRKQENSLP
jgi:uncharacterized protein YggE